MKKIITFLLLAAASYCQEIIKANAAKIDRETVQYLTPRDSSVCVSVWGIGAWHGDEVIRGYDIIISGVKPPVVMMAKTPHDSARYQMLPSGVNEFHASVFVKGELVPDKGTIGAKVLCYKCQLSISFLSRGQPVRLPLCKFSNSLGGYSFEGLVPKDYIFPNWLGLRPIKEGL